MESRLVDIKDVEDILYRHLFEIAMNSIGSKCEADEIYMDIAEHRLRTWLNMVPGKKAINENNN